MSNTIYLIKQFSCLENLNSLNKTKSEARLADSAMSPCVSQYELFPPPVMLFLEGIVQVNHLFPAFFLWVQWKNATFFRLFSEVKVANFSGCFFLLFESMIPGTNGQFLWRLSIDFEGIGTVKKDLDGSMFRWPLPLLHNKFYRKRIYLFRLSYLKIQSNQRVEKIKLTLSQIF